MKCSNCGKEKEDCLIFQGKPYCEECFDKLTLPCENCGNIIFREDAFTANDDKYYCEKCFNELFTECSYCSEIIPIEESFEAEGNLYCEICFNELFTRCYNCLDIVDREQALCDNCGNEYCESCFNELFTSCFDCGDLISMDDAIEIDGNFYCQYCAENAPIKPYGFTPELKFKNGKNEKTNLFFGIELEVEGKSYVNHFDTVKELYDYFSEDEIYCKYDGSLNNGFEIVFHPLSWKWYKENKHRFENMLNFLKEKRYISYDAGTCGMHVHMSREAFSSIQLYKLLKLFYEDENKDFIRIISQRKESQLESYASIQDTEHKDLVRKAKSHSFNRYSAVNVQNSNTIEIRIFRGTLNFKSFCKNMEFCKAIYEFTRVKGIKEMTWEVFAKYVNENRKSYMNLYDFMDRKDLLCA